MAPTEQASTVPAQAGIVQSKVASGKVVKYIGTADVRSIDANAWKSIGVENQGKVTWNAKNRFTVPVSDLTDNAVAYLDEDDNGFAVVDADTK